MIPKRVLLLSFDLLRSGDPETAFAMGSLLAYLQQAEGYGETFEVQHLAINLLEKVQVDIAWLETKLRTLCVADLDSIALSCYIWNEYLINPFISCLRRMGFRGKIILGGYQISYGNPEQLRRDYPDGDIFISGYAEASLLKAIHLEKSDTPIFLNEAVDFSELPSPYLNGTIAIRQDQPMLRWETKRGCPYRCTFCAHRDLTKNRVYRHDEEKIFRELELFQSKNVARINILDPIFNAGSAHLGYLEAIADLRMNSIFTLQTRFELIKGERGRRFLDLAAQAPVHLEFGIQTLEKAEYDAIDRPNDLPHIASLLPELNRLGISYEISLIYGLPHQTLDSFRRNIDTLVSLGCKKLVAYPLMLLKGTELYAEKERWGFVEKTMGDFQIPTVIASHSFTETEWVQMGEIAQGLAQSNRI